MAGPGAPIRMNPFSPSAVAGIGFHSEGSPTVGTTAVDDAVRQLERYLRPDATELEPAAEDERHEPNAPPATPGPARADIGAAGRHGVVLAIVGDYGTGKTHLAIHLLRRARREREAEADHGAANLIVYRTYLEASGGGFGKMYKDFVTTLRKDDVTETVRDYYSDIVAEQLAGLKHAREVARELRGGRIAPESVVEGLGLIDSLLATQLRRELIKVTRNEDFGIALTMLLRREEFSDDVWNWLSGAPPTAALVERGISRAIMGEEMSLEAMGVFACLFGRRYHRFVVVIDELDKVLTSGGAPDRGAVARFRKLFEVFQAAGAFLVVVGLPDLFESLGKSVEQRVSRRVDMSRLSERDVRLLIEQTHRHAFGAARLEPFTQAAPTLLARLADGTIRQVIRLCHRSYQFAIEQEADRITEHTIQGAARTRDDFPTIDLVRHEVGRELDRRGLIYLRDRWIRSAAREVDFWVTNRAGEAGCAVVLTTSIVSESDARSLTALADAVRAEFADAEPLLVVVGYLDAELRPRLAEHFATNPFEYERYGFAEDLGRAVTAVLERVERREGDDIQERILDRLITMHRQQTYTQGFLDKLAVRLDDLESSSTQLPAAVRRELRSYAGPAGCPAAEVEVATALPEAVDEVFQEAFAVLSRLDSTERVIRAAMSPEVAASELAHRQQVIRTRLNSVALYSAVGTVSLLRCLVDAFRSGVADLYDQRARGGRGGRAEDLAALCHAYEAVYDHVQMSRLDDYPLILMEDLGDDEETGSAWAMRRHGVRKRFDQLGLRVREAARPTFDQPPY